MQPPLDVVRLSWSTAEWSYIAVIPECSIASQGEQRRALDRIGCTSPDQFQRLSEAMIPGDLYGCGDQEGCILRQYKELCALGSADFFSLSVDKERFTAYILLILW
jgi:hypothetical protein